MRWTSASTPRGFGLIELMVAMAIGLVLMAATLTLYLDMSRSNAEMARTNAQIENGAMAIELLREDIQHAGFWDGFVPEFDDLTLTSIPADYPTALPDPCLAFASWTAADPANRIGLVLQLYSAVPTGCSGMLPNQVSGSDVLVVRHADTCVPGVGNCETDVAGALYFQPSQCEGESPRYVLDTTGFTRHQRNCTGIAPKRRFISNIYYLRDYAVTVGDGIPTLMRSSIGLSGTAVVQQAAVPMVEGVEGLRFEVGVDNRSDSNAAVNYTQAVVWANPNNKTSPTNRGDGAADATCTAATCTLGDLVNAVSVKAYLLVRPLEASPGYSSSKTYTLAGQTYGPFTDGYKRHVYSAAIRLNNVSGRRETP